MAKLPIGNYKPLDPTSPVGSCNCVYPGPYNEQCEFYHKEYHMGGYISTCLNQDIFGWCECNRCPKNKKEAARMVNKPHLYPCRCCGLFPSISPLGSKWYISCSDNLCPCTVTVVAANREEGIDIWNNLNTPNE